MHFINLFSLVSGNWIHKNYITLYKIRKEAKWGQMK